jgi:hypothetical protein
MMEGWNNGKVGKEEDRMQETENSIKQARAGR